MCIVCKTWHVCLLGGKRSFGADSCLPRAVDWVFASPASKESFDTGHSPSSVCASDSLSRLPESRVSRLEHFPSFLCEDSEVAASRRLRNEIGLPKIEAPVYGKYTQGRTCYQLSFFSCFDQRKSAMRLMSSSLSTLFHDGIYNGGVSPFGLSSGGTRPLRMMPITSSLV